MAGATLNVVVVPRRMYTATEAAQYCGIPPKNFAHVTGIAPVSMPGGKVRYDVRDLDVWIDTIKMGTGDSDDDVLGRLA
jgi:hypothetical protein